MKLGRRNVALDAGARLLQPVAGQVEAPDPGIVDHVAGDVGQLEGQPEIAGAVQHRLVPHAHDAGHHHAHDACDVIAVIQRVVQRPIVAPPDVHRETVDQVQGPAVGKVMPPRHRPQRGKWRADRAAAVQGLHRVGLEAREAFRRVAARLRGAAEFLPVHHVIGVAAPGVKHHRVLANARRHQLRRRGEALRACRDGGLRFGDRRRHAAPASASITPAVAFAEPTTPGMPAPGWVPAPTM